jgi:type I restriction enzyme S subunit
MNRVTKWAEVRVGDLGQVFTGRTPSTKCPEYFGNEFFFITPGDMHQGKHVHVTERGLSNAGANILRRIQLPPKSICVSCIGWQMGEVVMTSATSFTNQQINSIVPNGDVDADFLYYSFVPRKQWLLSLASAIGVRTPILKKSGFCDLRIMLPPLPTQRKIAAILSAFDDLIENNLRRIKILEEMAQNLYREWFVKFRFPGHQQARFTDSPMGPIPEGWLGSFPDFVDFKEGPGLRKWQYRSEGLPFLNIRTLVHNDIDLSKVQYLDKKEVEDKYKHFLLEEYDHVVSSSGTLGRIVTIQKQHLPLMLNTSIIRMRPSTSRVGRWQLKHFLNSDYFQHQILSFAIGAAQPNFGPSHLQQMLIVSPSDEIGVLYEETVEPLEEMIGVLVRKNTTLRRTRDLLLPKLISGEVDVSELKITTTEEINA